MVQRNLHPELGDEIDIANLKRIVARFKAHHRQRLAATRRALTPQRRRALAVLPCLYHHNHPALPGYISPTVPAGICDYQPTTPTLRDLKVLAPAFRDQRERAGSRALQAIYLMGSSGSIAQTRASDVDVWVCCPRHLHASLWPKVHLINQWADGLGLTLQTFLVDPESFRANRPIPGCSMPTLVLDEFYRSATLIAGRYPLWWLVPPEAPADHDGIGKRLRHSRHLDPKAMVDFGPVGTPPLEELARGAAEELGRALSTPYKSLLKLKLVEAYAHAREAPLVSQRYKQAIYRGEDDSLQLDAYMLVYQHLETHLVTTSQTDQLELVRRLLARKILQAETSPDQHIAKLCQQWDIDTREILDKPNYRSLFRESQQVNAALKAGLNTALQLDVTDHSCGDYEPKRHRLRVNQLQRLVEPLTRTPTGSIPRLNPSVAPRQYRAPIAVSKQGNQWLAGEDGQVIYRSRRLVELLAWAHINNLTNLRLTNHHELQKNLQQIRAALRNNANAVSAVIFANAEICTTEPETATLLSHHDDPLDYSGLHHLQIVTLDIVSQSTASGYRARATRNRNEMLMELTRLMNTPPRALAWEAIGNQRRYRIQMRLRSLHRQLHNALRKDGDRFVFPFGGDLVCAEKRQELIATTTYANAAALHRALRGQPNCSTTFDNLLPRLAVLQ